jgi:hypothetical protein
VAKSVKQHLPALQDGMSLLRRVERDLTAEAVATVRLAVDTQAYLWPELEPHATPEVRQAMQVIQQHLKAERPWEDRADLEAAVGTVRGAYRKLRQGLLLAHEGKVDAAILRIKQRDGFERLNPDQSHQVISHVREGAPIPTKPEDLAPPLHLLDDLFATRLQAAEQKAQAQLDDVLQSLGESPTVEVDLELRNRVLRSASDLDRVLGEIRDRIVRELEAGHRVRLK